MVENKRLAMTLEVAKAIQEQRDDWRRSVVSRTHRGEPANANHAERRPGTKTQRAFTAQDIRAVVEEVCSGKKPKPTFAPRKPSPALTAH
ncbi:hypothetical protein [Aquabacterium humicola]|uniref:hypothetical protein n=1 Tax=Aquabacterium humicola TaxID=3237377 RepID=UPI002542C96E|nr:hypothetical protein [Rubrivivax pictus]